MDASPSQHPEESTSPGFDGQVCELMIAGPRSSLRQSMGGLLRPQGHTSALDVSAEVRAGLLTRFLPQGSGHDFLGTVWHPSSGFVNNCDGGRGHSYCDYKQA
jgi:hypothetical protein